MESSLRARKKAATRTAIADAAGRLFGEHGFDHVSVESVARAAGVSKQTVFNYFPTKEDLVFDRAQEVQAIMVAALRERGAKSPVDAFRELTRAFWSRIESLSDDRPQASFFRISQSTPSLRAYSRELGARVVAALAEELRVQAGASPDDPIPRVVAGALGSAHYSVFEIAHARILAGESPREFMGELLDRADRAYDLLEAGLRGWPR